MKEIWLRLGRTDAINWIVITVVSTLQFVGSFVITNSDYSGREALFIACVVVSVGVVVGMLLAARYVFTPFVPLWARPAFILVAFEGTAIARALVFNSLLVSFQLSSDDQLFSRIYGSQFNIFVAGLVVSSLVSMARDFSESNQKLVSTLEGLRAAQESLEIRLSERRQALVSSIRSQLDAALSSLTGTNMASDARSLTSLIDDVVRPISHRLGREFASAGGDAPTPPATPIRWSNVVRSSLQSNPIHPGWLTLWTSFITLQVIAAAAGPNFWLPYVSAVVGFGLWFTIAYSAWHLVHGSLAIPARGVVFSLLMLATPLVVNPALQLAFNLAFFNLRVVVAAALYFLVIAWALAMVIAVARLLKSTNRELLTATQQLRRQLITDNVNARHFEQAVSHVLHGPIQDAIAASLKRIQSLPETSSSATSEGGIIRQHIEGALEMLDESPSRHYSVDGAIQQLSSLWSGVVEISCRCDKVTTDILREAQTTSSIVIEVIREAVSNAIRHGDATQINISIALVEPDSDVHISVTNNGAPLPKDTPLGMGSRLLRDMTMSWSRQNLAGSVVLSAVVPLQGGRDVNP
jgi:two-component sensor histidine kinase